MWSRLSGTPERAPSTDVVAPAAARQTGASSPGTASAETPPPGPTSPYAGGPPRLPKRYVYMAAYGSLALLLMVGLGVFLINRYGSTSTSSSTSSGTVRSSTAGKPSGVRAPADSHELAAPLGEFMDINSLKGLTATGFTLTDAKTGATVSLSSLSGHVVVLTFANAQCNDVCPVLATELHEADSRLGRTKVPVTFVTINTDPLDTKTADVPILDEPQLASLPNWMFLTGTIQDLDPVWRAYGVSITVDETSRQVSHNDPLYFVSPAGKLEWSATVFGDETTHGHFTLPAAQVSRYAKGLAQYADRLAGPG